MFQWSRFTFTRLKSKYSIACLKDLGSPKQVNQSAGACKSIGGKLPLPMNSNQNYDFKNEILRLFTIMNSPYKAFVLDLNDVLNEGDFIDSFGNQPAFTNWRRGEPNDSYGEDYVTVYTRNGLWNDMGVWYYWMSNIHTICQLIC